MRMAMVAGTVLDSRTAASIASAVSTFVGKGRPCVIKVDSRATTGAPSSRAAFTSRLMVKGRVMQVSFFVVLAGGRDRSRGYIVR